MNVAILILVVSFILLLIMNVPISFCIGFATLFSLLALGIPAIDVIAPRMATGIDSFALLAIPFFILMGLLMGKGGMAKSLIDFAESLVGWLPGGLAFVNVLACMFMGAISGSSIAAVCSIGGVMIPQMNRKGYDKNFNIALTCCAATTGLLIPPSNVMIVYAVVAGSVSIAALFLAGIIPGIIVGLFLMAVSAVTSIRKGYGGGKWVGMKETVIRFIHAVPGLALVFFVLWGIISGKFTPTEAASIAVLWAFVFSFIIFREIKLKELPGILVQCGVTTAVVMLLIGVSTGMSWLMASQNIPQMISQGIMSISSNKIAILLMINILLLFIGTFLDMTPAILIFGAIFIPIAIDLNINLIHFGIIMITNLCIGLCTPPVGTVLFVGVGIGNGKIAEVFKSLLPMFAVMIIALMLITYIPQLSLFLPRFFSLMK
ncbi:MAG: TRAP transporter large permease [Candidatus Marinimicrobia bacterium]|nr:TRAP transporter large permease [Candidatus Neomarinimicrobiota bacterium]